MGSTPHPQAGLALDATSLRHVLQYPIRQLLMKHGIAESRVKTATTDELVELVERTPTISQAEVDSLYDQYRYGTRPTFYLYLIDKGLPAWTDKFEPALLMVTAPAIKDPDPLPVAVARTLRPPAFLDSDVFGSIEEVRLRYEKAHDYIDIDGNPSWIIELRYAFVWVDRTEGFVAVVTRDKGICRPVLKTLSTILGIEPIAPQLSRKTFQEIVEGSQPARLRLVDGSGIGRAYSGVDKASTAGRLQVEQEVEDRFDAGDQPRGGLYSEIVANDLTAKLSISAQHGSIALTKVLSRSQLQTWAIARLIPIVRLIKATPVAQLTVPRSAYDVSGIPKDRRRQITDILRATISARVMGAHAGALKMPTEDILAALSDQLTASLMHECPTCSYTDKLRCQDCGDADVRFDGTNFVCARCNTPFQGTCAEGHAVSIDDPIGAAFVELDGELTRDLVARMKQGSLDPQRAYITIWRRTVFAGNRPNEKTLTIEVQQHATAAFNIDSPGATASAGHPNPRESAT